ncbi:MAG: zinc ribbon domain-containing protein [Candidatus Bathyarchaeia archaeon]|nr:zinc ribbon domain-containing protein [Candidatus Bathyarchaeota archaeon]
MSEKPTAAFVLSLLGGIFILLGGVLYAVIGAYCGALIGALEPIAPGATWIGAWIFILMALGVIFGIIVIVGSIMIYQAEPNKVKIGSILVIVFSILSLFVAGYGGFFIGLILGLIGGILGLVWKPSAPPPPTRICPNCGAQIDASYNVCPYCGKVIPKAP